MRRYDFKPGEVVGFEILFDLVRCEPGIRWRDIVKGLRRTPLQRAGRVHCRRGHRALETRGFFDFRQEITGNGRDMVVENKGTQAGEVISRGLDQCIGCWMLRANLLHAQ
jgi:hypothetical protein